MLIKNPNRSTMDRVQIPGSNLRDKCFGHMEAGKILVDCTIYIYIIINVNVRIKVD